MKKNDMKSITVDKDIPKNVSEKHTLEECADVCTDQTPTKGADFLLAHRLNSKSHKKLFDLKQQLKGLIFKQVKFTAFHTYIKPNVLLLFSVLIF